MKKTNIIYWIFTGLLCGLMLFSAIGSFANPGESIELMHNHLGYPIYFITMLSVAKILGVIALLTPGFPKLKEWAYAGFTFDLIAAVWSCLAVGDPIAPLLTFIIFLALVAGSYIYHQKRLKGA